MEFMIKAKYGNDNVAPSNVSVDVILMNFDTFIQHFSKSAFILRNINFHLKNDIQ